MAAVLIEHAKTGQEPSRSSSTQSQQISLFIDQAKTADPFTYSNDSETHLKIGLQEDSDPSLGPKPPRASPPEPRRASPGPQDLGQRQLEILRTMLRTPVTAGRPDIGSRQSSTQSSSSATSSILSSRHMQSPAILHRSSGDLTYIMPNSPPYKAEIVRPVAKKRDSTMSGLAGLKEFLRSLQSASRAKYSTPMDGGVATFPNKSESHFPYFSHHVGHALLATEPVLGASSTPGPPTEFIRNHTSPISFSTMRGNTGDNTPTKDSHDRPKIRRFFRSSSTAWQDYVKGRPPSNQSRASFDGIILAEEEECKVDGLPNHAQSISRRSEILGNFGLYEDRTITQENKSRIVGLGWPNELGASDSLLGAEPQRESGVKHSDRRAPERTGKGQEGLKVAVTPEDLLVLLEYLKQCKGKLEEWRRRVEMVAPDTERQARVFGISS